MKLTTRIYLDAALQNIKSITFFTFLQVLIARLGASNFEIALSNMIPPFFCALSLAFLTRQLPVNRTVFMAGGYIRQFAFLSMAFCVLLPNPIPYLLTFWTINAASVMVTSAQQPAILRKWVKPDQFPAIFSMNKIIGISIATFGGMAVGAALDATNLFFPKNFFFSMLIGCLATFGGMSLIAELAPREKTRISFKWMKPFQECDRKLIWMGLNNIGISMAGPLYVIYHVKVLGLSNTQIAYFVVTSGILSALLLPVAKKLMMKFGTMKIYGAVIVIMALAVLPYGFVHSLWLLVAVQGLLGLCFAISEVSSQSIMMEEADKHKKEMAYFSDFQLVMQCGAAAGAILAGALVSVMPLWGCFIAVACARLLFFGLAFVKVLPSRGHRGDASSSSSAISTVHADRT